MAQGHFERNWDSALNANWQAPRLRSTVSPSLGIRIHEIRQQKHLTQADFAQCLGFKGGVSAVSDIERGVNAVGRDFVERLSARFNLPPDLRSELLLAGRFLSTRQDLETALESGEDNIRAHPLPVLLTDFGGRVLEGSDAFFNLFGLQEARERLTAETPNWVEVLFDPAYQMRNRLGDNWLNATATEVDLLYMNHMKYNLAGCRWQELLLVRLNGYPEFRQLWNESSGTSFRHLLIKHPLKERKIKIVDGTDRYAYLGIASPPLVMDARMHTVAYIPEAAVLSPVQT